MNLNRTTLLRTAASIALATSVIAVAGPALSEPNADNSALSANRQQHRHERLQTHLDRMAEHLKITSAQQTAWAAYAGAVENLFGTKLTRPAADADAASVARFRANLAAERAQKLSQLADATAALRLALNTEQQQELDKLAHRQDRRMHHHRYRG